jgi:hypothetical protein
MAKGPSSSRPSTPSGVNVRPSNISQAPPGLDSKVSTAPPGLPQGQFVTHPADGSGLAGTGYNPADNLATGAGVPQPTPPATKSPIAKGPDPKGANPTADVPSMATPKAPDTLRLEGERPTSDVLGAGPVDGAESGSGKPRFLG